jgi:hypothetical protein
MSVAPIISWKQFVAKKWLLWDACAIIKIIKYDAEDIFADLAALDVTNIYINPVQLELLATTDQKESIRRSGILTKYFDPFPFGVNELEMAKKSAISDRFNFSAVTDRSLSRGYASSAEPRLDLPNNRKHERLPGSVF